MKKKLIFGLLALFCVTATFAQDPPDSDFDTEEFRSELVAITFEDDSVNPTPSSAVALDSIAVLLRQKRTHPRYEIHGHTCADATMRFSVQRVETMINYLLANGVPTANITSVVNPPAGTAEVGCIRDRRVEIMLIETRRVARRPVASPVLVEPPITDTRTVEDVMEDGRRRMAATAVPEPITPPISQLAQLAAAQDKQALAIYMAGEEPVGARGVHNIMGGELARVISESDRYLAVDRTEVILEQLAREHIYQRSGAVDDDQIKALGQQLGVQYLCISNINPVGKRYYLDVRLVDVVTAEIMRSVTATSRLRDANDMSRVAREIALELIETDRTREQRARRKKIFRYTAIGLDVLGLGAIAYGVMENHNAEKFIDSGDFPDADRAVTRRNAAYIVGGSILAAGVSIHILF